MLQAADAAHNLRVRCPLLHRKGACWTEAVGICLQASLAAPICGEIALFCCAKPLLYNVVALDSKRAHGGLHVCAIERSILELVMDDCRPSYEQSRPWPAASKLTTRTNNGAARRLVEQRSTR